MSQFVENKAAMAEIENKPDVIEQEKAARDFKADAIEAENAENAMTVMQAVRAYPMACFWAFVMSFTIVRHAGQAGEGDR